MMNWQKVKDGEYPQMGLVVLTVGACDQPITAYRVNTPHGGRWLTYDNDEWVTGVYAWAKIPLPDA